MSQIHKIKFYTAVPLKELPLIKYGGLKPSEINNQILLSDNPETAKDMVGLDGEPFAVLELMSGDIDLLSLRPNEEDLKNLMKSVSIEELGEYEDCKDVPWSISLKHVNQVGYPKRINPCLLTIAEVFDPDNSYDFKAGLVLNPEARKTLWKDEVKSDISRTRDGYLQQFKPNEYGEVFLPKDIQKAFVELGNLQRDLPESAMLEAQDIIGGNLISGLLEHIGDLTHRMSHHAHYNTLYHEYFFDKVEKTLNSLTLGYGHSRDEFKDMPIEEYKSKGLGFFLEYEEGLKSNARGRKIDFDEYKNNVLTACKKYSEEHSKLPVYNFLQWQAREAAIKLGNLEIEDTISILKDLKELSADKDKYSRLASQVNRDRSGEIVQYQKNDVRFEFEFMDDFKI